VRVEGRVSQGMGATNPAAHQAPRGDFAVPRAGVPPVRPSFSAAPPPPRPTSAFGSAHPPMPITGSGQAPMPVTGSVPAPTSHTGSVPSPMQTGPGMSRPASVPHRPTLTLIFQRKKIPINAQQFIIGRGSKSSDLAIKDPNISRKHAAIIFHNGVYYMKDLGSTNGIEYKGKQVDSKRIDEGDVFTICGYDLHFTYSV
jgi:neural Wiskott-Aldrich syndrome protein